MSTPSPVAQPADQDKPVAASPAIVVSTPHREREAEPDEMEAEETPVKVTRTSKKTPQRSMRA